MQLAGLRGSIVFSLARGVGQRGRETDNRHDADPSSTPTAPRASVGTQSTAISAAVVGLLHDYTRRGPTQVRTTIAADAIVVTLRNSLTKAERSLAASGQGIEVLAMRRAIQHTMREDLIAAVEQLSDRVVEAFLSDNLYDPDVAVEIFLLTAPTASVPAV